ncbi:glycosyltransferase [Viscerimonas tarda]
MEQFFLLFQFDYPGIIALAVLFGLFLIQIFFYCFFYNKPRKRYKKSTEGEAEVAGNRQLPSVSVILTATDESENLAECLPLILNQDYPDYEVIVVNNGLTDETDMLLKELKLTYPHLYDTFLPNHSGTESSRKQLAETVGIKAAKKDVLLFTEADTLPSGNKWIAAMMSEMKEDKEIVVGYCHYNQTKKFVNRIARFDHLLFSVQYMASALIRRPYTAIYRNVAYRKELFFDNKGFSMFLNYKYSDGIFLNYIMSAKNTAVALSPDSFVTTKLNTFAKWERIRTYQYKIQKHFKNFRFSSHLFSLETFSRLLFYLFILVLTPCAIVQEEWGGLIILGLLFVIRMITALIIINKAANYMRAGKFLFSYIVMDLLQPFYNARFKNIKAP